MSLFALSASSIQISIKENLTTYCFLLRSHMNLRHDLPFDLTAALAAKKEINSKKFGRLTIGIHNGCFSKILIDVRTPEHGQIILDIVSPVKIKFRERAFGIPVWISTIKKYAYWRETDGTLLLFTNDKLKWSVIERNLPNYLDQDTVQPLLKKAELEVNIVYFLSYVQRFAVERWTDARYLPTVDNPIMLLKELPARVLAPPYHSSLIEFYAGILSYMTKAIETSAATLQGLASTDMIEYGQTFLPMANFVMSQDKDHIPTLWIFFWLATIHFRRDDNDAFRETVGFWKDISPKPKHPRIAKYILAMEDYFLKPRDSRAFKDKITEMFKNLYVEYQNS